MSGRIVQFGTSRFLQAHADLMLHEARLAGQPVGPVTIVQTTADPARAGRVDAFNRGDGFPVVIRGLDQGLTVDRTVTVTIVDQGLSVARDWARLIALFEGEVEWVISNTGDTGYAVAADDPPLRLVPDADRPASFPAMLALLLWRRWCAGGGALTILPCELIQANGARLKAIVTDLATAANGAPAFLAWLSEALLWCDTLVDRIVSAPIEPIGAVAEPYMLWAIRDQPGFVPPCIHPALIVAADLEPFERLKLHILNLGHTWLAQRWIERDRPVEASVRAMLAEPDTLAALRGLYRDEVVPGFATRGLGGEAATYVATTLDRFANPFLDHRLADIAQNHTAKIERRIGAFLTWAALAPSAAPRLHRLALASA